jgi:phosphoglycolate phosphatase
MNLFFDLDGTLTDPEQGITACIRYALRELNLSIADNIDLTRYIGPPLLGSFEELCKDKQQANRALEYFRQRFTTHGLYENRLYDGITEALSELASQQHAIYVVTSKPTIFAIRIIEHFKLAVYFKDVYGSDLDGSRADKTELIAHVLEQRSCSSEHTVMIGDRRFDIQGAKNNGILAIGAVWGHGTEQELINADADTLCEHPGELVNAIARLKINAKHG